MESKSKVCKVQVWWDGKSATPGWRCEGGEWFYTGDMDDLAGRYLENSWSRMPLGNEAEPRITIRATSGSPGAKLEIDFD